MNTAIYVPLVAFTLISFLFVYVSIDEFMDRFSRRGFALADLGSCLLKVGVSALFFLPVVAIMFSEDIQWYVVEGITVVLILGALCAIVGQVRALRRPEEEGQQL